MESPQTEICLNKITILQPKDTRLYTRMDAWLPQNIEQIKKDSGTEGELESFVPSPTQSTNEEQRAKAVGTQDIWEVSGD